ncbi:MAG: hypothetical protein JNM84_04540, partial [Planctomycetes bacterium]|nr:hypothetical protein [Planctomycetota bacterium]
MLKARHAGLLLGICGASCESYAPAPVDLTEHALRFAARLPDAEALRVFVDSLRSTSLALAPTSETSGAGEIAVRRDVARWIALHLNPDLAIARLEAGVAGASAEYAGLLEDPSLNGS